MLLDTLPKRRPATITSVDWSLLPDAEGRRLRALGVDEGAVVETHYRGIFFGRDPLAVKIGRMTVAIRRMHALAITVSPNDHMKAADA